MQNVYEVRYVALAKSTGEKRGTWVNEERLRVLANGSVEGALKKARAIVLKKKTPWTDDEGVRRVERNMAVRFTSCERIMELDG